MDSWEVCCRFSGMFRTKISALWVRVARGPVTTACGFSWATAGGSARGKLQWSADTL